MTIFSQYRTSSDSLFPIEKSSKKGFYVYLDGGNVSTPESGNPFSDVTTDCKGSWEMSKSSARSLPAVACIDSEEIPPPP